MNWLKRLFTRQARAGDLTPKKDEQGLWAVHVFTYRYTGGTDLVTRQIRFREAYFDMLSKCPYRLTKDSPGMYMDPDGNEQSLNLVGWHKDTSEVAAFTIFCHRVMLAHGFERLPT
jgi:hypothetical protein